MRQKSPKRYLQAGDTILFKRVASGNAPYKIIYIMKKYVKKETKTKIPRFQFLVISVYSHDNISARIFDKGQGSLRNKIEGIVGRYDHVKMKEVDSSKELGMLVQYGSVRNIILRALDDAKKQRERYIKWYQDKMTEEQGLLASLVEMEPQVRELDK